MNSPADVDNDLPMNNEEDHQVLEPVAVENMDEDQPQINQSNDNEQQLSQLANLEPIGYVSHSSEDQINNIQPVNDDTEMEVNQPTQLVNLQPIAPSQHDLMLEDENDNTENELEMEDNSQVQRLVNFEVNREEDEEDESDQMNYARRIKIERNLDSDEEFVNLNENSSSIEDLKQQSSNDKNDDEEFVNLDENTEPLSGDNQDEEFVNLEGSAEILDLDRHNSVTYNLDQTTSSINIDQNSSIINLDHTHATINLDQTQATIDLDESTEILDLDRNTSTYNSGHRHAVIDLNPSTSRRLLGNEEEDVKPNIELLTLEQKIAYLEEPMSDEEDVKPNIEELNLAFNINHLDHLDINQSSQDSKPQKSNKSKSKSKSKTAAPEPINSAQVIQVMENDQVVQIINMNEVITTATSTMAENDDKVIQVTNVEQVIENNQVVHVLNMDEALSTDSDQPIENNPPNQPIVINIPSSISSEPSSSQRSPTLSQSSQSNSAGALKRKNITEKQKHLIEFLHLENGLTAEQIRNHDKLRREDGSRILLKTIKYWLDRLKKTGEMQTKHRSGRPRFLDPEKEKQLLEYIDSHTKKNYHMVKIEKQLQCTRRTINNYALRNGIKAYRALKKPSLNDFQKKRRLMFCEEWLQRFDDCQKIIFTDEKLFNGQPTNTYQLVRRRKGERFLEENISHTIRPQPKTSTNIWVYIGPFGKGEIFLAENDEYFDDDGNKIKKAKHGTTSFFNATSYRNMLEKRAIPSIKERIDDFIFQQDNASIHCAKNESKTDTLVGELLKRENITTMYWPPLSPDLNPVENVHHLLQVELNKELTTLDIKPKNKADVFALCKECWERVDNNTVKKIYFSFYSRLEKVKERNGANNY